MTALGREFAVMPLLPGSGPQPSHVTNIIDKQILPLRLLLAGPDLPECLNDIPGSDDSVVINDNTATRSRRPCGGTGDVPYAVAFLAQVLMKELNPWRISPAS